MSFAPVISPTGIIVPTYADILALLKAGYRSLYGSDVDLDDDTQDGQLLAIFASAIKDQNDSIVAAYNAFSPATAQGVGLSSVVKINGIRRLVPSNSQVVQRVVGQVGIPINGGQVCDPNLPDIVWALPPTITIPPAGFLDVTATALVPGATPASPGTLTQIVNPQRGWQSTTNTGSATPGEPVEDDANLRLRQGVSTAIPALSVVNAILGAIKNIIGVGRAVVYENDTGAPDANGIPAHSISAVAEGGDIDSIGAAIARYKTPGTGTYGTTTVDVTDGVAPTIAISFYELSDIEVSVLAFITARAGYLASTGDLIKATLAEWFITFAIGEDSAWSKLWSPINLMGDAATDATGLTQQQLDVLSNTYNATAIYQARPDMAVIGGPYAGGATTIHVTNTASVASGQAVALLLDNATWHRTTVNGAPVGMAVVLTAAVPGGRTIANGVLLYTAADLTLDFNEAALGDIAHMTLVVA